MTEAASIPRAQAAPVVGAALALSLAGAQAEASTGFRIAPYKDELFRYEKVLGTRHDGDFVIVEFVDSRDVGGRDEVRLKKAWDKFVSLEVNETKKDLTLGEGAKAVRYMGVGATEGPAKMVVIFLHGQHGDRRLAMEDHRFGGNFNRLKNLMARNGGAYLSPDFSDFGKSGMTEIKRLVAHYAARSPGAPIVVGCASTGCKIVYRLLHEKDAPELLDGVVLLGALPLGTTYDRTLYGLPMFSDPARRVPIYIGHGSSDETVIWVTQELFFKTVKAKAPGYPIRFELFHSEDAVHGTPLRMVDWRLVLNWILEENEQIRRQ